MFLLGMILWVLLALWPAMLAKRKGYSFILFLILSWFVSFIITLLVVLFLKDKNEISVDRTINKTAIDAQTKKQ
ncbi:MAG TPA: hypothetical protein PKB09_02445 [Candidatus Saccharibacteria bacterium]|nr:hypothetical protein [Candidatus Saccharibacteria bacterium]